MPRYDLSAWCSRSRAICCAPFSSFLTFSSCSTVLTHSHGVHVIASGADGDSLRTLHVNLVNKLMVTISNQNGIQDVSQYSKSAKITHTCLH